jgi:hypothetical protein
MGDKFYRKVAQLIVSGNFATEVGNLRRGGDARALYQRSLPKPWLDWSQRRINTLAASLDAKRYLEIGIYRGNTIERINVRERVGVDPVPRIDVSKLPPGCTFFAMTSDAYFASLDPQATFDVAFIDGLHTFEQTKTDLFNTLRHVPTGPILLDDTVPEDEAAALPELAAAIAQRRQSGSKNTSWMGDVWKLVMYIDRYLPQLDFRTIVGSGNEQTLVWRRQPGEAIVEQLGNELGELSYREVFADGIPAEFRPCGEAEALATCLAALKGQH